MTNNHYQDNSSSSVMRGSPQLPFTDSFRSDILLLSSYLGGQQSSLIKSNPMDENLAFSVDISTLLSIGNRTRDQQALNVNTIMKKHTTITMELLVCAENASGEACSDCQGLQSEEGNCMGGTRENAPGVKNRDGGHRSGHHKKISHNAGVKCGKSAKEVGDLVCITPITENGRKLLHQWDPQIRNNEKIDIDT